LPPPFAEQEAEVVLDREGQRTQLPRDKSWAFRRQADAFVADMVEQRTPLASGADSVADIAVAEAIWKRQVSA
jgi:predicted dehydrogenase